MNIKKILLINGGMRKNGTSFSFARTFEILSKEKGHKPQIIHILDYFQGKKSIDELKKHMSENDIIGIMIPTYVNTLPFPTIWCLEQLADNYKEEFIGKDFFAVAQGGMALLSTHQPILDNCRYFAEETKMNWRGGLICTLAPLINGAELENLKFRGKPIIKGCKLALENVLNGETISHKAQKHITLIIPKILSYPAAALLNYVIKLEIKQHGITDMNPKPYL